MGGEKRVTVITPCARRGAKTAGFNQLRRVCSCKRACVCVTERESGVSGDGDVAGNASATVARPRQPQPPLHRPRLSPPPDSPSISLSPCSSPPPPFSTLGPPSALHPPPRGDKDKKATASSYSVTLERGDAVLLFVRFGRFSILNCSVNSSLQMVIIGSGACLPRHLKEQGRCFCQVLEDRSKEN